MKKNFSGGGARSLHASGFPPERMMIHSGITIWRKWNEYLTRYFDDNREGMKNVTNATGRLETTVTKHVLAMECARNSTAALE